MNHPYSTPAQRLLGKLELAWPALQHQAAQMWSAPYVRQLYPLYLQTMHSVVRTGVPLMQSAINATFQLSPNDPLRKPLIAYLSKHLEEERGHDEWLLEDYEATGGRRESVLSHMPTALVANLAGAQYYWIAHHHPITLMGHITALESYHPPAGFAQRLSELTGYSMDAFRAIARHEKLDLVHKRDIHNFLNELPLTEQQERAMGVSGLHTMQCAAEVLSDIYQKCELLYGRQVELT